MLMDNGKQCGLRLFLSADLAGSTAYKQNTPPEEWQRFFRNFYRQLPALVVHYAEENELGADFLSVWKLIGDEVVFSRKLNAGEEAAACVRIFRAAVEEFRRATLIATKDGLDVKAAGWTAGFPVGNICVEPFGSLGEDYVGPGMDIGFRLVKAASPRRMLISVELAWLLTLTPDLGSQNLFMDEGLDLKGVALGLNYPCIWFDNFADQTTLRKRDQLYLKEEWVRHAQRAPCDVKELHDYCGEWLEQAGPAFCMPFIEGDPKIGAPPPGYKELYDKVLVESEQGLVSDANEPGTEGVPLSVDDILGALDLVAAKPESTNLDSSGEP